MPPPLQSASIPPLRSPFLSRRVNWLAPTTIMFLGSPPPRKSAPTPRRGSDLRCSSSIYFRSSDQRPSSTETAPQTGLDFRHPRRSAAAAHA
ncbi:MAG: hypothetical protein J6386_13490 [Candidatus Synoicihabitans palmerolidicus]|nr:hypothetical protein [Candidatus Synoicihabitans palmerolidicus]